MGGFLAALFLVVSNRVGAGRHPILGHSGCRIVVALGVARCPIGGKGAGTMVWQLAVVEGRLVAPHAAPAENHRSREDQSPQPRPQT